MNGIIHACIIPNTFVYLVFEIFKFKAFWFDSLAFCILMRKHIGNVFTIHHYMGKTLQGKNTAKPKNCRISKRSKLWIMPKGFFHF